MLGFGWEMTAMIMHHRLKFALFWTAILLLAIVIQVCCPQYVHLGPPDARGGEKQEMVNGPDLARVRHFGCRIDGSTVVAGKIGWGVWVWADYSAKAPGAEHDWQHWFSFRQGKNADEKAGKDCREWMRALRKCLPQPQKKPEKEHGK